jgi:hypothetical protein
MAGYDVRNRIIEIAGTELYCSEYGKPTPQQLDAYAIAAVGKPYAASERIRGNWCGAFAVYCIKMAGLSSCRWGINPTHGFFGICGPVQFRWGTGGIQWGDAAIMYGAYSHHVLVADAVSEYDYLQLIEGNGGEWGGELNKRTTSLGNVCGYYHVLCD